MVRGAARPSQGGLAARSRHNASTVCESEVTTIRAKRFNVSQLRQGRLVEPALRQIAMKLVRATAALQYDGGHDLLSVGELDFETGIVFNRSRQAAQLRRPAEPLGLQDFDDGLKNLRRGFARHEAEDRVVGQLVDNK